MNPKEDFHNIAYSVRLPYIAGHLKLMNLMMGEAPKKLFIRGGGSYPQKSPPTYAYVWDIL